MNALLWIAQGLLAATFLASGLLKGTQSKARMIETGQSGVGPYPLPFVRFIAVCELLAAVGVVVPWATGIAPGLTVWAASGLGIIMIGAAFTHAKLHEPRNVAINIFLLSVCVAVAIGRGSTP